MSNNPLLNAFEHRTFPLVLFKLNGMIKHLWSYYIHLGLNPYFPNVYRRAIGAGFPHIDMYFFPDKRRNGTMQAREFIEWLRREKVLTNQWIWVDIEDTERFLPTVAENIAFVHEIINEFDRQYKGCGSSTCVGIYANTYQWGRIMGENKDFRNRLLWFPRYDKKPNFDSFIPFGGWTSAVMKQYDNTTPICNTQIDFNYYEQPWW
ncbi:hypothetical protein GEMRC1_010432 [Eukaryota sp. GEM-RC1]